jgi:hypothetical protein
MTTDKLLTPEDVMEIFPGSTRQWLLRAAWQGKIPSRKVGRLRLFTEDDIKAYIESVAQNQKDSCVADVAQNPKDPWAKPRRDRRTS